MAPKKTKKNWSKKIRCRSYDELRKVVADTKPTGKIDPTDPRLKHFNKTLLRRLERSGLTIKEFKNRIYQSLETKITEEEFRREYIELGMPLAVISKRKRINRKDLSFWARDKLGIEISHKRTRYRFTKPHPINYTNIFQKVEEKITEEEFRRLYSAENKAYTAISREKDIRKDYLSISARKKHGIKTSRKPLTIIPPEYFERYENGESRYALAEELGISRKTFKNALLRQGMEVRDLKEAYRFKTTPIPPEYIERYENGEDSSILAKELEIRKYAFLRTLNRLGVDTESIEAKRQRRKKSVLLKYTERYESGEGMEALAEELGIHRRTFRKALESHGIKIRSVEEAHTLKRAPIPLEFFERYDKGESAEVLAQELEICSQTFLAAIERNPDVEKRTQAEAIETFKNLVPPAFLERYERGEEPEQLAKELGIGRNSFINCVSVLTNEWKKWEDFTRKIAQEIDSSAIFQSEQEWGIPDVMFTHKGLKIIADAKINGERLGNVIKKYTPHCDILEIWCLRNPQKNISHISPTGKKTIVLFYSAQQLLARIKDKTKRIKLNLEFTEIFSLFNPDLDSFINS
ncbi:MAG: hypothetical protein ACFFCQ_05675 [Promethearchaeota archaeon]